MGERAQGFRCFRDHCQCRALGPFVLAAACLLFGAPLASCRLLDLRTFAVASWSPREKQLPSVTGIVIEIRFSKEANRRLTEQAFSVAGDGALLSGRTAWSDDRTLRFTPAEPLRDFVVYSMEVSPEAEDTQGHDLQEPFAHTFTTKTDFARPTVLSATPADHSSIADPLAPISVTFSKAMDPATLYPAFSLSPPAGGFLSLRENGTVLTFSPTEQLAWQTEYAVSVAKSAADRQRNSLGAEYSVRFFVGTDTTRPSVSSVRGAERGIALLPDEPGDSAMTVTEGWESTEGLVVTFSKPVLTASALAAASVSPAVLFSIAEASLGITSTLTYSFPDRLAYGSLYTLTLSPGIQDAQGNRSAGEWVYHLVVNGPLTRPPSLARVRFPSIPADSATNVELTDYGAIDLSAFSPGVQIDTFFDLYVDLAAGATLDPFAIADSFGVSTTNDAADIHPFAVQINPTAPQMSPPPSTAGNQVVARVWVHLTNNPTSGQIALRLSTDLKDSRGTPLVREVVMPLNDTH